VEVAINKNPSPRPVVLPRDPSGLVWGYRFDESGCATALDGATAITALASQESWIWLHFDLIDPRARAAILSLPNIPADAVELLLTNDDRQRLDAFDHVIAGVVADFERSDDPDPRQMVTWRFCMAEHVFISARRRPLHTIQRLHEELLSGRRFGTALHLLDGILHAYTGALSVVSRDLYQQLDQVEDGLLADDAVGDYETLGLVRRKAVRLHRQAMPLRAMLDHMVEERPAWFNGDAAEDFEQVGRKVSSVSADLVSLQQRAHALQDELSSRQAAQINKRLMVLSVFSAVILPPTLITGMFGMNVDGLPLKDHPHGFAIVGGIMTFSVVALLWWLRRAKLV
jgi:zinc transporter